MCLKKEKTILLLMWSQEGYVKGHFAQNNYSTVFASSFCCAALPGRCVLEISVQPLWGGLQLFVPLLVIILCLLLVCAYLFRSLQALRKNQHQQDTLIMLNQRQSWREKDEDVTAKNQETSEDENGSALLSVQVQ